MCTYSRRSRAVARRGARGWGRARFFPITVKNRNVHGEKRVHTHESGLTMMTRIGETVSGFKLQKQSVFCFVTGIASVLTLSSIFIDLLRQDFQDFARFVSFHPHRKAHSQAIKICTRQSMNICNSY